MARSAFNEYSSISSSPPMFLEDINEDESWKDFCEEVFHALSYPSSALYLYNKGTKNLVKSHEGHWQRRALTIHVDETCLRSMEEVRSQSSRATRRVRDAVRLIWWEYECHCFHCDAINSISLYCLRRVAFYFIMVWETTSISPVPLLPRLSYLQVPSFAMAAGRNSTQPTYDFLTGASSPPPPSFRETLRTSHVVRPGQLPLWPFAQAHP